MLGFVPIDVCENALLHFWKLHNTNDTHSTVVSTLTHTWLQGKVVAVTNAWALLFFLQSIVGYFVTCLPRKRIAMVIAVLMILRVWAMCRRSRLVLYTLLMLYVVHTIAYILSYVFSQPSGM